VPPIETAAERSPSVNDFSSRSKENKMTNRREALKHSAIVASLLAAGGVYPYAAIAAVNTKAFEAKSVVDVLKALGAGAPVESKDVTITAPDIAENGAVVPMGASSSLPGIKQILILVEKNPSALIATFNVSDAVDANFATRAKMGQSSDVYAIAVMTDGRALFAKKEVKVTLGGCGG
jgi:sulfur-oxidizing protein SoxY